MKEITKYWKQTCIDFGKFVTAKEDWTASTEYMTELWNQFQEQQAKEVVDILDDVDSNDQINCYCGHTTMCDCEPLNRIEKAREPETKQ